jgi:histidinol-phosphate aminotransferase
MMAYEYERVTVPSGGLRLHLNENTAGCSPRVLSALKDITREQAGAYPDYQAVTETCAAKFGVGAEELLLTNGLDEGIMAVAVVTLRPRTGSEVPEAIVIVPAFDMYAPYSEAAGAAVVEVPSDADFGFPVDRVLAAITPATRLIFVTTPNNPSGRSVPAGHIFDVASAARDTTILVDEAYADFAGETLIGRPELARLPNVIVGRTFSKAHGLAGLRIGALIGQPATLAPIRRFVPPYSLNACAVIALTAALDDEAYYEWYIGQVLTSKTELYAALQRLGVRHWRSDANFVLADFGVDARRVVEGLADRHIYVRDKSHDDDCRNCVRITAGIVEHTRACIAALEEVLCDAQS